MFLPNIIGSRKLALVEIIPYQIIFSFSSDKDRRTDSRIRRKNTAQPRLESNPESCEFQSHAFSSDPAVSYSIFVAAEREENLIRLLEVIGKDLGQTHPCILMIFPALSIGKVFFFLSKSQQKQ